MKRSSKKVNYAFVFQCTTILGSTDFFVPFQGRKL